MTKAERTIILMDEICDETIAPIIAKIEEINIYDDEQEDLYYDEMSQFAENLICEPGTMIQVAEYRREPIVLKISSPGGSVSSTIALINTMNKSRTFIITENPGECCSGGFWIFISGHHRVGYKSSSFMYHNMRGGYAYDLKEREREYHHQAKLQDKLDRIVTENTYLEQGDLDYINEKREDKYWDGLEALEVGIVDELVDYDPEEEEYDDEDLECNGYCEDCKEKC